MTTGALSCQCAISERHHEVRKRWLAQTLDLRSSIGFYSVIAEGGRRPGGCRLVCVGGQGTGGLSWASDCLRVTNKCRDWRLPVTRPLFWERLPLGSQARQCLLFRFPVSSGFCGLLLGRLSLVRNYLPSLSVHLNLGDVFGIRHGDIE